MKALDKSVQMVLSKPFNPSHFSFSIKNPTYKENKVKQFRVRTDNLF